jgi:PAS domain S-box-containing protein
MIMPDVTGQEFLKFLRRGNIDTSVIVITGHSSLDGAINALRHGAYDYLRKPFEVEDLIQTLRNALQHRLLKQEKEAITGRLAISEDRYRFLIDNSPDIIYTLDENGSFTFVSKSISSVLGYQAHELMGNHYTSLIFSSEAQKACWTFNERRTGERVNRGIEIRLKTNSGSGDSEFRLVELKSTGLYDKSEKSPHKKFLGTLGVIRDIGERKQLEAQLHHAERMQALGTLSGGIAHDFNNLLMAIQGNASVLLLDLTPENPMYQRIKNIEELVERGSLLTKQLLGFARGGKYSVKPVDLNEVIEKTSTIFGRTKKEIRINFDFERTIRIVEADRGQIEMVLMNIYVNAWQAMPDGGEIFVRTRNIDVDEKQALSYAVKAGKYVLFSVEDTGIGMDEKVKEHIFEPFFTTKEVGKGTGLGLASVYGIIQNHGGFITVWSRPGKGSRFDIYLPASEKKLPIETTLCTPVISGNEKVLLIVVDVGADNGSGHALHCVKSGTRRIKGPAHATPPGRIWRSSDCSHPWISIPRNCPGRLPACGYTQKTACRKLPSWTRAMVSNGSTGSRALTFTGSKGRSPACARKAREGQRRRSKFSPCKKR